MVSFSDAIAMGALGSLAQLWLSRNRIGDEGMQAFSLAIATGVLTSLQTVYVFGNPGNAAALKEACNSRGIECM